MAQRTPKTSTPASAGRPRTERAGSPLLEDSMSDRNQIQSLNHRLATYIQFVKQLEENAEAHESTMTALTNTFRSDYDGLREKYENEITHLRTSNDRESQAKSRATVEASKARTEAEEESRRAMQLEKEVNVLKKNLPALETENGRLRRQLEEAGHTRQLAETEALKAKQAFAQARDKAKTLEQQLEEETLTRVAAENQLLTTREELLFQKNLWDTSFKEMQSRYNSIVRRPLEEHPEYQNRLHEAMETMRADFEHRMGVLKTELNASGEKRTSELRAQYEMQLSGSSSELRRLQDRLRQLQEDSDATARSQMEEIERLKRQIGELMREQEELMEETCRRQREVAVYNHLLDGEEERLNISTSSLHSGGSAGRKRRRVGGSSSSSYTQQSFSSTTITSGAVHVKDADLSGKFVELQSAETANLVGWVLKQTTTDGGEVLYKFTRGSSIKADIPLKVWSSGAGKTVASDIAMKDKQWLPVANQVEYTLLNSSGDEHSRISAEISTITVHGGAGEADKSCAIM